jgi:hypothetical protein
MFHSPTTTRTAVADGVFVPAAAYDAAAVFDCRHCHDSGLDPDCEGHKVLGRYVFCPCPVCAVLSHSDADGLSRNAELPAAA